METGFLEHGREPHLRPLRKHRRHLAYVGRDDNKPFPEPVDGGSVFGEDGLLPGLWHSQRRTTLPMACLTFVRFDRIMRARIEAGWSQPESASPLASEHQTT
jgi:hypothetical protein